MQVLLEGDFFRKVMLLTGPPYPFLDVGQRYEADVCGVLCFGDMGWDIFSLNNIYFMKFQHTIIPICILKQCSMGFRNKLSNLCNI